MTTSDDVKVLYTVGELAKLFGKPRRTTARILEAAGVTFTRSGNRRHVSLTEIEERLPRLWRAAWLKRSVTDRAG